MKIVRIVSFVQRQYKLLRVVFHNVLGSPGWLELLAVNRMNKIYLDIESLRGLELIPNRHFSRWHYTMSQQCLFSKINSQQFTHYIPMPIDISYNIYGLATPITIQSTYDMLAIWQSSLNNEYSWLFPKKHLTICTRPQRISTSKLERNLRNKRNI